MSAVEQGKRRGLPRWIWVAVPLVLLAVFGARWVLGVVSGPSTQWLEVARDDLELGVDVEGILQAVETTLLGPPQIRETWQFKVASMADEGDEVKAGAPVLAFDTSELQQNMQEELAERDAALKRVEQRERELAVHRKQDELALEEARAELRKARLKAETPGEMAAAAELAQIRLDLELAEKRVVFLETRLASSKRSIEATLGALRDQARQAEQRVEQTESSIEQMTRLAPTDGTVIYVKNWQGEKKGIGDSCWRGEYVLELPDLGAMKAAGQVHEADAGKVAEGQRMTFRLDAHPDLEFSGSVASIWRTVQVESWRSPLKVVRLEIELDETDARRMRPGMRFRGRIETDRVEDALVVDAEAVFRTSEGPVVHRKTWAGYETIPVELGRRNKDRVEVLGGLDEGDAIATVDLRRERGRS
jgi:HlyD family secretion protein